MQGSASVYGNTADSSGGGVYVSSNSTTAISVGSTFTISGGIVYGNSSGELSNTATNGNGAGAALLLSDYFGIGTAQYGTFNENVFTSNGDLDTTDDTIEVVEGALIQ